MLLLIKQRNLTYLLFW